MATTGGAAKQQQPKIEDFDLGGDVTLLVGPTPTPTRVTVSKALLCFASKYFATLFSNTFKEGDIATTGKEVKLNDDEPKAFVTLCKILHMRYDTPDKPLAAHDVLGVAIVADKYDCVHALALSVRSIFPEQAPMGTTFQGAGELVCAAYLLDQPLLFERFTQAIMRDYAESFLQIAFSEMGRRVPMATWRMFHSSGAEAEIFTLESTRADTRAGLVGSLNNAMALNCPKPSSCGRAKSYLATHIKNATVADLAPYIPRHETTAALIAKTAKLRGAPVDNSVQACSSACLTAKVAPSVTLFIDLAKAMEAECRGLCIDCVRAEGRKTSKCRIVHA
ncbi:hypothetical protein LTR85_003225 [Meristemomyces frigidus]|nr:hypothetical protein LTR85_003225 [Meristemomyces frigidus]